MVMLETLRKVFAKKPVTTGDMDVRRKIAMNLITSNTFEDDYIIQTLKNFVIEYNCPSIDKARTIDKYAVQLTAYMCGRIIGMMKGKPR